MTFLKSGRLSRDLDFIRAVSQKIDKKISMSYKTVDSKLCKLTLEELQDLSKITGLADFMLNKYADKKETRHILEYFTSIIYETAESIEKIDDEVAELIISSEDHINKIKQVHMNISEKYDLEKSNIPSFGDVEDSANNLTKIAIEINSQEYLENSTDNIEQVI